MDLAFEGTDEERRSQAEVLILRMARDLYGNGKPGMMHVVGEFMTEHQVIERDRHRANTWRLNAIIAVVSACLPFLIALVIARFK